MLLNILAMPLLFFPLMMLFSSAALDAQAEFSPYIICTDQDEDTLITTILEENGWDRIVCPEDEAKSRVESGSADIFITKDARAYIVWYSSYSQTSISVATSLVELLRSMGIESINSVSDDSQAMLLLNSRLAQLDDYELDYTAVLSATFIPMTIILVCSMAAGVLALALTVREREQNTLEYLFATGISAVSIVMGKFFAVLLASCLAGIASVASIVIYGFVVPNSIVPLDVTSIILLLVCIVMGATLFSSVFLCIGCLAKTQREGQLYTGVISIVAMLPAYFLSTTAPGREPNMYGFFPILNYTSIARDALYGIANFSFVTSAILSTICIVSVTLLVAVNIMASNRIFER